MIRQIHILNKYGYQFVSWNFLVDACYCASGAEDVIVSERYPNGTPATVLFHCSEIPGSQWIWGNPTCKYCQITVTKSFFLVAPTSEAILYMMSDDDSTAKINNQKACSTVVGVLVTCNTTPYTTIGLNEPKIEAKNYPLSAALAYKLVVKLKF